MVGFWGCAKAPLRITKLFSFSNTLIGYRKKLFKIGFYLLCFQKVEHPFIYSFDLRLLNFQSLVNIGQSAYFQVILRFFFDFKQAQY
jgi:hypothetical protein